MWPLFLAVSVGLHVTVLLTVGGSSGSLPSPPARPFDLVNFSLSTPTLATNGKIAPQAEVQTAVANDTPKSNREIEKPGTPQPDERLVTLDALSPQFYKSSEVSHSAQLQLPLESALFSGALTLSGRLILDISVSDLGKVVNIEVVEASDVSGALRAHMLPLLMEAPFTPAYKNGKPVNSVRRIEFTLGIALEEPAHAVKTTGTPGLRPALDARGNILKDPPKP